MIVRRLTLRNFRNIAEADIEFAPGTTLVRGANAQGKTNLLESLAMLAHGRSFRTREEREILPWGAPSDACATIVAEIDRGTTRSTLAVGIQARRKRITLDGSPLRRVGDLLGLFRAVVFLPEDLELVHGAPALRRMLLDMLILQTRPALLDSYQRYDSAMRHRNSLLRKAPPGPLSAATGQLLETYEQILAIHGPPITRAREEALALLAPEMAAAHQRLQGGPEEGLEVEFQAGWGRLHGYEEGEVRAEFAAARDGDRARGQASIGCQRDDFRFLLAGRKAAVHASQGQRRSIVIATKIAEVAVMARISPSPPMLLLDDLLSELDQRRQEALVALLPAGVQTIVTATDASGPHFRPEAILECHKGSFRAPLAAPSGKIIAAAPHEHP